jgi:hypothetical protein
LDWTKLMILHKVRRDSTIAGVFLLAEALRILHGQPTQRDVGVVVELAVSDDDPFVFVAILDLHPEPFLPGGSDFDVVAYVRALEVVDAWLELAYASEQKEMGILAADAVSMVVAFGAVVPIGTPAYAF